MRDYESIEYLKINRD